MPSKAKVSGNIIIIISSSSSISILIVVGTKVRATVRVSRPGPRGEAAALRARDEAARGEAAYNLVIFIRYKLRIQKHR